MAKVEGFVSVNNGKIERSPAIYRFIPLRDFDAPEFSTTYCEGMVYSVRPGNARLDNAAKIWAQNGLVRIEDGTV